MAETGFSSQLSGHRAVVAAPSLLDSLECRSHRSAAAPEVSNAAALVLMEMASITQEMMHHALAVEVAAHHQAAREGRAPTVAAVVVAARTSLRATRDLAGQEDLAAAAEAPADKE